MDPEGTLLVTADVMARVDGATISDIGIPAAVLMENAGQKAWAELIRRVDLGRRDVRSGTDVIVFVSGNGNNGGDCLVMARQCLLEGQVTPRIVTVRNELRGAVADQWDILSRLGCKRLVWENDRANVVRSLNEALWIVDGITGTGLSGPLREGEGTLVRAINSAPGKAFSVDVPSGARDGGASGEEVVHADVTVCTGYRKRCLYAPARRSAAGDIVWVDPGFPDLEYFSDRKWFSRAGTVLVADDAVAEVRPLLAGASPDAHKGARGRLLIVGGSSGTEGAALLAAEAAGTAGAGMVAVHSTAGVVQAGLAREPGVMWRSNPPEREDLDWADALLVGPGWTEGSAEELTRLLSLAGARDVPVILDAAALRIVATLHGYPEQLSDTGESLVNVRMVLTPHPGELAALTGETVEVVGADPFGLLDDLSAFPMWRGKITVLLKASASILRQRDGTFRVFDGRCPALGVAGSGDVLSGIIGARVAASVAAGRSAQPAGVKQSVDVKQSVNVKQPDILDRAVEEAVKEHLHRGRVLSTYRSAFSAGELSRFGIGAPIGETPKEAKGP